MGDLEERADGGVGALNGAHMDGLLICNPQRFFGITHLDAGDYHFFIWAHRQQISISALQE
jgi:hypothetical protein